MAEITSISQRTVEKAGFTYLEIPLRPGSATKQWLCPRQGMALTVERAVLSHFEQQGWRGYHGEGGLLLNLIKCMSFPTLPERHRLSYIEAIYAQNIAFKEDRVPAPQLLRALQHATPEQVKRNFTSMLPPPPPGPLRRLLGSTPMPRASVLDHFPGLETWMLLELFEVAGRDLLLRIASLFASNPYEYRKGWPDITMWKNGTLRFVEVKAPGDVLGKSQRTIASTFAVPLELDFSVAAVTVHTEPAS